MYDLIKADDIYNKKLAENPEYDHILVTEWRKDMPYQFAKKMYEDEYGCHIYTKEMYDKAVHLLKWTDDKGHGAKWDVDTIVKLANVDFDSVDYYKYDIAYAVNMFYSDYCIVFNSSEPSYYIKMAKIYLTDTDYYGKADERAYHDAEKRIKYYEEN